MSGNENPYVGPRPFRRGERLYGREGEIRELLYRLTAERIVLLHSPSGAGKSSLIEAGLIPLLERDGFDVWPAIRLGLTLGGAPPAGASNPFAESAIMSLEEGLPARHRRPLTELHGVRLKQYIDGRPRRPNAGRSIILAFDQFEEVLTLDPIGVDRKHQFFQQLGELLEATHVWALFVMREDYLAQLTPYEHHVPTRFANTFRLDLLGLEAGRAALVEPAKAAGRAFEPAAADALLRDLATVTVQRTDGHLDRQVGNHVEPLQLQVVCRRLWDSLPATTAVIDRGHLEQAGDVDEALSAYFDERVAAAAAGAQTTERAMREWLTTKLITPSGIRAQVLTGPVQTEGLDNRLVHALRDAYLIRAVERAGATWFELSHDRLVAPVRESTERWLADHLQPFQRQADAWRAQNEDDGLLLRGRALTVGRRWGQQNDRLLADHERRFLGRSTARRRTEQLRTATMWSLIGVAVTVASYMWVLQGRATAAAARAEQATDRATATLFVSETRTIVDNAKPGSNIEGAIRLAATAVTIRPSFESNTILARALRRAHPRLETNLNHPSPIDSVAWSPDGARIATAAGPLDGAVFLWDARTGQPLGPPRAGHTGKVTALVWSPDGAVVASADANGAVRSWDVDPARPRPALAGAHQGRVTDLQWLPDGRLASASAHDGDGKICLWDWAQPPTCRAIDTGSPVWKLSVRAADGQLAAALDHGVAVWSAAGEFIRQLAGHQAVVIDVAWSPDGRLLATADRDGRVCLWTDGAGDCQGLEGDDEIVRIAWSADGRFLATARDAALAVWEVATRTVVTRDDAVGNDLVWALAWRGGAEPLLAYGGGGGVLRVRTVAGPGLAASEGMATTAGDTIEELFGHDGKTVNRVAWSPNGQQLASASDDETVKLWRFGAPAAGLPELHFEQASEATPQTDAAWTADGRALVSIDSDGGLHTFGVADLAFETRTPARVLCADASRAASTMSASNLGAIAAGSYGRIVAGAGSCVTGWHDANGARWASRVGSQDPSGASAVTRIAVGETWIAAALAGSAHTIAILGAGGEPACNGPLVEHHGRIAGLAFEPGGDTLASGDDTGVVLVWSIGEGGAPCGIRERYDAGSPLQDLAWSANGGRLAAAFRDGHVEVLQAGSSPGALLPPDLAETESLREAVSVAWSPDGRRLAVATSDANLRVWDLESRSILHTLPLALTAPTADARLAWSPDGRTLASLAGARVMLWDPETGTAALELDVPRGEPGEGARLTFSPNGEQLALMRARSIWLWRTNPDAWFTRAQQLANRGLTEREWQSHAGDLPYRPTFPTFPGGLP